MADEYGLYYPSESKLIRINLTSLRKVKEGI